jgi:hypothetical protein
MVPALGPIIISTLTTSDSESCVAAWCQYLEHAIHCELKLSYVEALKWGCPELVGTRVTWLENNLGEPWLRIIEDPLALPMAPFQRTGWLSLEVCVGDVDALYLALKDSPFNIIGKPADLDISPNIRAMQVVGPAGEVLYLTQVKAAVRGFDLPVARCPVDRLFIPILLTKNRQEALATYEKFHGTKGLLFDTKITVVNRAWSLPLDQSHPVATVQLNGKNLIEIDQLPALPPELKSNSAMRSGISMISFALQNLAEWNDETTIYSPPNGPFAGIRSSFIKGATGEWVELMDWQSLADSGYLPSHEPDI